MHVYATLERRTLYLWRWPDVSLKYAMPLVLSYGAVMWFACWRCLSPGGSIVRVSGGQIIKRTSSFKVRAVEDVKGGGYWCMYKYRGMPSTALIHWRCHLEWRWNVCNLNTQLVGQNLTKTSNLSYDQHRFSKSLLQVIFLFRKKWGSEASYEPKPIALFCIWCCIR